MAERWRMPEYKSFAYSFVMADKFLDMSVSARCLYFYLCMGSYDKGVVINANTITKAVGCESADLDELVNNGYLEPLGKKGHYSIVHWYDNLASGDSKKRLSYSYRKWRDEVLERDGYSCRWCGSTQNLEVHHIKPYATNEEERLNVDNGLTLCKKCHRGWHKEQRRKEKQNGNI